MSCSITPPRYFGAAAEPLLRDTLTTPMLLKTVQSRKLGPSKLITHLFKFGQILSAYDIFGHAARTQALKVIIEN